MRFAEGSSVDPLDPFQSTEKQWVDSVIDRRKRRLILVRFKRLAGILDARLQRGAIHASDTIISIE